MKYAILLAMCCIVIPINGQSDGTQPQPTQEHPQNAQYPIYGTISIGALNIDRLNVEQQQESQGESNKGTQGSPSYFYRLIAPETLPNTILCLVGFAGVIAAFCTLRALRKQAGLMKAQLTEMGQQTGILKESVAEAKESADAAYTSARVAMGVAIPTLILEEFGLGDMGVASPAARLQSPKVRMVVKNYGQTPAFPTSWSVRFTCEELPKYPIYKNYAILKKISIPWNGEYVFTQDMLSGRQRFADEDVQAMIRHEKFLIAYGQVMYRDIFGSPLRHMKFCQMLLEISDDGSFAWYGDMEDTEYTRSD